MNWKKVRHYLRIIWVSAGLVSLGALVISYQAHGVPDSTLRSDERISVRAHDDRIGFLPSAAATGTGLVFYPGGMVDPLAYAPLARSIAAAGHPVWILKLPLRNAPFKSHHEELFAATQQLIAGESAKRWVIAGHSKGGLLAAEFARDHERQLAGLVLIGTTHPRDFDLSKSSLPITKIYGTNDRVADFRACARTRHLLPVEYSMGLH